MAAVVASHHAGLWPRRNDHAMHMSSMNMSAMMSSYDTSSRSVNHPPTSRPFQATTSHMEMHNIPMFSSHSLTTSVPYQPGAGAFAFDSVGVNPYNMQQTFPVSYPPALAHSVNYPGNSSMHPLPAVRDPRAAFPMERTTPPVKSEASSPMQSSQLYSDTAFGEDSKPPQQKSEDGNATNFATDVDTLMRAIQGKEQGRQQQHSEPPKEEPTKSNPKPKKRYLCSIDNCGKSFYQKTHLEIHTRAHTGIKPFICKEPTCGQRFSQLGNLKTHERRHTGERPYSCDICGKTFAQRGNVRAHKIVHQQVKPFTCRLDDCGKTFTQLGNLKSHQNKFHANTLQYLTKKFGSMHSGEWVSEEEKTLWEYFSTLYKNSNKGIKGRGKDRRIPVTGNSSSTTSSSSTYSPTTATSMNRNYHDSFHHGGSDRDSRSSSLSSDCDAKATDTYDFNASLQTGYHGHTYDDTAFPERRLY